MIIGTSGRAALALGSSSTPPLPGMLISDRIKMIDTPVASAMRWSAAGPDWTNSMVKRPARRSCRNCCRNSSSTSGSSSTARTSRFMSVCPRCSRARQNDPKLGEFAGLCVNLDRPRMLLHDDVVTDGEAKPRAFSGRFSGEERGEQLLLHLRRNTRAIVADTDFHPVAEILGRCGQGRLLLAAIALGFALRRRIEAVRDQVQQNPGDVLWEHVGFTGGRIEGSLQGDVEARLLGPRPVIGEIEALLDQPIDVDKPVFTRAFARMQQHVLDNGIRPLAVLHDLGEIAPQCVSELGNLGSRFLVNHYAAQGILQFIDQFGRNTGEIIDEIERVLDLVGNASGELTKRSKLLCLDQSVLRRP